jgi:hypothetical protein
MSSKTESFARQELPANESVTTRADARLESYAAARGPLIKPRS